MFKITPNMLLDNWSVTGNDPEELKEITDALTSTLKFKDMHTHDLALLSFFETGHIKAKNDDEGGLAILLDPLDLPSIPALLSAASTNLSYMEQIDKLETITKFLRKNNNEKVTPELFDELTKTKLSLFYTDPEDINKKQEFFLTSGAFLQTSDRFGLTGHAISTPSFARDYYLAEIFSRRNVAIKAVVREVDKVKKVFTLLSDKYCHIPQSVLFEIVEHLKKDGDMGKVNSYHWEVDNFITKWYVEFPEKAKEFQKTYKLPDSLIPGLLLVTSDTGNSSFKVFGTWRIKGSRAISIASEFKRKHIGKVDGMSIKQDITESIFPEYAAIPEALCKLMTEELTDSTWDLTKSTDVEKNAEMIKNIVDESFKALNIVKCCGKKVEKELKKKFFEEFSPEESYTSYDFAIALMTLHERALFIQENGQIKNGRELSALQHATMKAPFLKYPTFNEKIKVVLTA